MAQKHPSDVLDGGVPTLPWQASTALLCLACVPVAWVCRATGARGWPDDLVPWVLPLIVLVGLLPYYMRRNHAFTLGQQPARWRWRGAAVLRSVAGG